MRQRTPAARMLRQAERNLFRRFVSKPPGWDEPANWLGRMAMAVVMGLIFYWVRSRR